MSVVSEELRPARSLRIALLQARDEEDPVRSEERRSFAIRSGIASEQITAFSVVEEPPSLARLSDFDAVMVGGAGDYFVSLSNLPYQEHFFELLREITARERPMFASCYGFQNLAQALGGEVIHAPERTEVGTYELELTEAGHRDPLLGALPRRFSAQMGRKDLARRLPEGLDNLARSALCEHQAFRVGEAPIWATQFHPELDHTTNRARFERYVESYQKAMSPEEIARSLDNYRPSREAGDLLRRFLLLVFE